MLDSYQPIPGVPSLQLAEGLILVSFWKPVVLLIPIVFWAWMVSTIFDKFAARFYLKREQWNMIHLVFGMVALAVGLLMPLRGELAFWAGLTAVMAILSIDIFWFVSSANKSELVPETLRLNLGKEIFGRSAEAKKQKKDLSQTGKAELTIKGPDKAVIAAPAAESPELAVRVAAEGLVLRSVVARGSQVDLAPTGKDNAYGEVLVVDGVKQVAQTHPAPDAIKIVDFWKAAGKLDIADRRKKLTADINIEKGELKKKLRVIAAGVQGGMRLTLLFDPEKAVRRKPEDLGLVDKQLDELKAIVEEKKGTVLVCTPPDGGRTTIFYTLLKMHDAYTNNVQSIEIDQQDDLEGIRQNKWDPFAEGPEFSTLVRSILRRDPDVVGVAEIPDQNTCKEICRADQERSRIYPSFKADNAIGALQGWAKLVGDLETAMPGVRGVVTGRVMRRLCTQCRQAYVPAPDMLKKFGLPADKVKQLYKKGGVVLVKDKEQTCGMCSGVGYVGQIGFFELYQIDAAMRDLLKKGDWNAVKAEFKKKQLPTLQQAALRHALDGITSIEEVVRATTDGQAPAGAPGGAPAAGGGGGGGAGGPQGGKPGPGGGAGGGGGGGAKPGPGANPAGGKPQAATPKQAAPAAGKGG
ncbi:MAG: Flp pilus assembly complex ATPase component TadA [Phycisphaerales bacterium]|nr:Flp pilus assembly complex ATPase component TadA [Phycisphaerales bacterium]